MIITATPEPDHYPPRVRLDFDSEGDEFLELVVLRDGRPIRQQPAVMGLSETFVYDYEAPFGVPVTYSASGAVSGSWTAVYVEDWADLTDWDTMSGSPSVSGGKLSGGSVARSDVLVAQQGRVSFASGSSGFRSLRVGPIFAWHPGGTGSWRVRFRGGPEVVVSSLESINWSGATAVVVHGSGTKSLIPGGENPTDGFLASAGGDLFAGSLAGFTYSTPASGVVSASASATLESGEAWLIHPIQPLVSVPVGRPGEPNWPGDIRVAPGTDEQRTYAARQAIYQPSGRREAVVFPLGYRSAGNWTLNLLTHTIDARNDLLNLLDDQAPVLLRSPADAAWDLADGWYAVGDFTPTRPVDIGDVEIRLCELPLTKVAEPPVKIAPRLTWGDLMLRGVTWGDLLSENWLSMLMGEIE